MNTEQNTPEMLKIMNDSDALLEAELAALERGEDPYANVDWSAPEAVMRTEPQHPVGETRREPERAASNETSHSIDFGEEQRQQCYEALLRELPYLLVLPPVTK